MRASLFALALLALAACSAPVKVGLPNADWNDGGKIPGRYAATIQSGAWRKDISAEGFACGGWTFPTDADGAYAVAMKKALDDNFESVTLTPEMKPADIAAQGYDASIIVYQGAFDTRLLIVERAYWTFGAEASVGMGGIVALVGPGGLIGQASPEGSGARRGKIALCDDAGPMISTASRMALMGFIQNATREARALATTTR